MVVMGCARSYRGVYLGSGFQPTLQLALGLWRNPRTLMVTAQFHIFPDANTGLLASVFIVRGKEPKMEAFTEGT